LAFFKSGRGILAFWILKLASFSLLVFFLNMGACFKHLIRVRNKIKKVGNQLHSKTNQTKEKKPPTFKSQIWFGRSAQISFGRSKQAN